MISSNPSYFVAGELVGLVQSYLDANALPAKNTRRKLLPYLQGGKMPIEQWWQLLSELAAQLETPALGLHIGRQIKPYHFGALGYLLMHTNTVAEALNGFRRYQGLLHNFGEIALETVGENLRIIWDYGDKQSSLMSDAIVIGGAVQFMGNITGRYDLHPVALRLNYPKPADAPEYEALLQCPVFFDADQMALEIPLDILSLPLNTHDPHLHDLLAAQVDSAIDSGPDTDSYLQSVQNCIKEALAQGSASELDVADQLAVSRRTLHRRLAERGTHYKALLAETRLQLANVYMCDRKLSLSQVAFLLGYSEQAAFTRAYKQWTGILPSHARQNTRE